jgi:hypothetical protein
MATTLKMGNSAHESHRSLNRQAYIETPLELISARTRFQGSG